MGIKGFVLLIGCVLGCSLFSLLLSALFLVYHPIHHRPPPLPPHTDQHYRAEFLGYDEAEGGNFSPVVYRSLTHLKTWELMTQGCSVEALVKHELWLHEQESRLLFTHPPSFPCRGLIVIIDISHMTMRQATRDVMTIFGAFSNASKPHHPERLTKLYVVGAPRLFPIVWKMLKVRTDLGMGYCGGPSRSVDEASSLCVD